MGDSFGRANQILVAPSAAAEGCHGEGVLQGLARARSFDGRGGGEPAGGGACAQPCTLDGGALARSVEQNRQRRVETRHRAESLAAQRIRAMAARSGSEGTRRDAGGGART